VSTASPTASTRSASGSRAYRAFGPLRAISTRRAASATPWSRRPRPAPCPCRPSFDLRRSRTGGSRASRQRSRLASGAHAALRHDDRLTGLGDDRAQPDAELHRSFEDVEALLLLGVHVRAGHAAVGRELELELQQLAAGIRGGAEELDLLAADGVLNDLSGMRTGRSGGSLPGATIRAPARPSCRRLRDGSWARLEDHGHCSVHSVVRSASPGTSARAIPVVPSRGGSSTRPAPGLASVRSSGSLKGATSSGPAAISSAHRRKTGCT
jgi:hypothetical protein